MTREDRLLTTSVAARMLGVHPETLRDWIRAGKVPAVKTGPGPKARHRILKSTVEYFMRTGRWSTCERVTEEASL